MAEGFFRFVFFSSARGKKGEATRRVGGSAIDRHVRVIHIGAIDVGPRLSKSEGCV